MTQTFMRFLYFDPTKKYFDYLRCSDLAEQKASDAFLYVTETDFFALDSKVGRRQTLCNLLGLAKRFE